MDFTQNNSFLTETLANSIYVLITVNFTNDAHKSPLVGFESLFMILFDVFVMQFKKANALFNQGHYISCQCLHPPVL